MKIKKIVAALAAICILGMEALEIFAQQSQGILEFEEVSAESTEQGSKVEYELDRGTSQNTISIDTPILDNIYLGTMNLSNMTKESASLLIEERLDEVTGYPIVLHMDDTMVSVPAKELGVSCEYEQIVNQALQYGKTGNVFERYKMQKQLDDDLVQLEFQYQVDEEVLQSALEKYCQPLNREVVNYGLMRKDGAFQVVPGRHGMKLNMEKSIEILTTYFSESWQDGIGNVDLDVELTKPRGSREELSQITTLLGEGSTKYSSSSSNRKKNIENAVDKLNGIVLYPGESLSVCNSLVPFSEKNGYYYAASYANGNVVDSLGGGICQVSTTLYLAVLEAELEVVERHNHSMTVKYVDLAMDAAIAEGSKDLIIKNNLEVPVYFEASANGKVVSFSIYGKEYRSENRKVTYESEVIEELVPTTELKANYNELFGMVTKTQEPLTGYRSALWKVVTENGQQTRERINTSYYRMRSAKYVVGMETSNEAAGDEMRAAIAENDIKKAYDIINTYGIERSESE